MPLAAGRGARLAAGAPYTNTMPSAARHFGFGAAGPADPASPAYTPAPQRWHNHLPEWVLQHPVFTRPGVENLTNRAVLQSIADACRRDAHGNLVGAYGGQHLIMRAGVSRETFFRARKRLEKAGLLVTIARGGVLGEGTEGPKRTIANTYGVPAWPGALDHVRARPREQAMRPTGERDRLGRPVYAPVVLTPGEQATLFKTRPLPTPDEAGYSRPGQIGLRGDEQREPQAAPSYCRHEQRQSMCPSPEVAGRISMPDDTIPGTQAAPSAQSPSVARRCAERRKMDQPCADPSTPVREVVGSVSRSHPPPRRDTGVVSRRHGGSVTVTHQLNHEQRNVFKNHGFVARKNRHGPPTRRRGRRNIWGGPCIRHVCPEILRDTASLVQRYHLEQARGAIRISLREWAACAVRALEVTAKERGDPCRVFADLVNRERLLYLTARQKAEARRRLQAAEHARKYWSRLSADAKLAVTCLHLERNGQSRGWSAWQLFRSQRPGATLAEFDGLLKEARDEQAREGDRDIGDQAAGRPAAPGGLGGDCDTRRAGQAERDHPADAADRAAGAAAGLGGERVRGERGVPRGAPA